MLIRNVVATASAMVASNWLPVPNSGQMVEIVPGIDQIAPAEHHQEGRDQVARQPGRIGEVLVHLAQQFLQHIARHARSGVNRRQDEQAPRT